MKELNGKATRRVRSAAEFDLEALGVSTELQRRLMVPEGEGEVDAHERLKNVMSAEEILYNIRVGKSHVKGVSKEDYDELRKIADAEGFIRHDFSPRTFGLMRFYRKILQLDEPARYHDEKELERIAELNGKYPRCYCDFESNQQYEEFQNFSEEEIREICEFLKMSLSEDEYEVLELLYGFGEDAEPRNRAEIARLLGCSHRTVTHLCINAEARLMCPMYCRALVNFVDAIS